jgi:hypothetical protein
MARGRVDGMIVGDQLEHVTYRWLIVNLAENARLPTVFPYREQFEVGAAYVPRHRRSVSSSRIRCVVFRPGLVPLRLARSAGLALEGFGGRLC